MSGEQQAEAYQPECAAEANSRMFFWSSVFWPAGERSGDRHGRLAARVLGETQPVFLPRHLLPFRFFPCRLWRSAWKKVDTRGLRAPSMFAARMPLHQEPLFFEKRRFPDEMSGRWL